AGGPADLFIEFPFPRRMFFANLLVLFGGVWLFGCSVLGLKIVLADFACAGIFGRDALGSQRAVAALRAAKGIDPRMIFPIAIAGASRLAVRAAQFIARLV